MKPMFTYLGKVFSKFDALEQKLSLRWREHSNRRTILIVIFLGLCATYLYLFEIRPPDNFPIDELVSIPAGASLTQVSDTLQSQGVVRSAIAFRVMAVLLHHARDLKSGDYLFKEPADVYSIARAVSIGAYGLEPIRIRVPEGATTKEMAQLFSAHLQRFNTPKFLTEAQPIEGFLFPDTYFFLPNANESTVIQALRQNFDQHEATIDSSVVEFGKPLKDDVIMASIIEREAPANASTGDYDRRMIAGVLWNRIAKGMPLQVDVTFLYTIGKGTFQLTKKDLQTDSPYNTYLHKGLPPTAIGSPSLSALTAAVTPIKNNYLYYLADSSGVTHFSKTYVQQLQNKAIYFTN